MISSLLQTGLNGMQSSQREMLKSADDIAKLGTTTQSDTVESAASDVTDIAEPIINLKIEQQVFDASAKIVKAADEVLGTLMDLKA